LRIACNFFSLYLSASGVIAVLRFAGFSIARDIFMYFDVVMIILFVTSFYLLHKRGKRNSEWLVRFTWSCQLLIPLNLLVMVNTRYTYVGMDYSLPFMFKLTVLVCVVAAGMMVFNIITRSSRSYKDHCFSLITLCVFAVLVNWNAS